MSTVYSFYGMVQGHNTVKSHCHRQGSIPNRRDVIKEELSVSKLRHRAQASFSEHTRTGKGMKLLCCIPVYIIHNYTK